MRLRARVSILPAVLTAALAAGCGSGSENPRTLRSDGQVAAFVKDVASGEWKHWTLATGASPAARRAWANEPSTKTIGIELRFGQAPWGCMEISMLRHGASTHEAVLIAKRRGGATVSANQLAVEYTHFTLAELGYIIDADCHGQPL